MGGNEVLPKASFGKALSYMVKSYVGPGCLSLPLAFKHAGWGLGLGILVFILVAVARNLVCIVLCKRHYEAQGVQSYADLALVTLGPGGRRLVDALVNGAQLGICAIYFDFVGENLHALLPASWGAWSSTYACMIYAFPVYGALGLLPSVKAIAPYTGLANFLIISTIAIVVGFAL